MNDGRKIIYLIELVIKTTPIPFFIANILYMILAIISYFNVKHLKLSYIWFDNTPILFEIFLIIWVPYLIWEFILDKF